MNAAIFYSIFIVFSPFAESSNNKCLQYAEQHLQAQSDEIVKTEDAIDNLKEASESSEADGGARDLLAIWTKDFHRIKKLYGVKSGSILTEDELRRLIEVAQSGGPDALEARNAVVTANIGLAAQFANKNKWRNIDFLDLLQIGGESLIKAVETFDLHKEVNAGNGSFSPAKFSGWFYQWTQHFLGIELSETGSAFRLPKHILLDVGKIKRVIDAWENYYHTTPRPSEIFNFYNSQTIEQMEKSELVNSVPPQLRGKLLNTLVKYKRDQTPITKLNAILEIVNTQIYSSHMHSRTNSMGEDDVFDIFEVTPIGGKDNPEEIVSGAEFLNKVEEAIQKLPPSDRDVVRHSFGLGKEVKSKTQIALEIHGEDILPRTREMRVVKSISRSKDAISNELGKNDPELLNQYRVFLESQSDSDFIQPMEDFSGLWRKESASENTSPSTEEASQNRTENVTDHGLYYSQKLLERILNKKMPVIRAPQQTVKTKKRSSAFLKSSQSNTSRVQVSVESKNNFYDLAEIQSVLKEIELMKSVDLAYDRFQLYFARFPDGLNEWAYLETERPLAKKILLILAEAYAHNQNWSINKKVLSQYQKQFPSDKNQLAEAFFFAANQALKKELYDIHHEYLELAVGIRPTHVPYASAAAQSFLKKFQQQKQEHHLFEAMIFINLAVDSASYNIAINSSKFAKDKILKSQLIQIHREVDKIRTEILSVWRKTNNINFFTQADLVRLHAGQFSKAAIDHKFGRLVRFLLEKKWATMIHPVAREIYKTMIAVLE